MRSVEIELGDGGGAGASNQPAEPQLSATTAQRLRQLADSARRAQPRFSLLGRPLALRNARQDARYRRLQARLYNFLERPKTWPAISYHVAVFASVFFCLILSVLSTVPDYSTLAGEILFYMEMGMLFWFFAEYTIRMWSAGCRSRYQTWKGRLQFAWRPFCIIDFIVIISSIVVLVMGSDRQMFAASALRGLRFFQILRMIRMDRRGGSWKLLASVVWAHRQELFTTIYIGFLGLILSSFLIYLAEKDRNDKINTYADALWWGVITLCTVGYGDTTPRSWLGKLIAGCSCLVVISFYALPPGILGSGFALKVQQHQRQKHLIRRRVPAAELIQCLWRCYAADPVSTSIATWKPHLRAMRSPSDRDRTGRFGRLSTLKRKSMERCALANPVLQNRRNAIPEWDQPTASSDGSNAESRSSLTEDFLLDKQQSMSSLMTREEDNENEQDVSVLDECHRNAIRAIRKIKFFVARRKFKEALRPYDVKDVIEQYSAGHVDMLGRIKVLQARLDHILGRQDGKDSVEDVKVPLSSHIMKVEAQVDDIDTKLNFIIETYSRDRVKLLARINPARAAAAAPSPPPSPPSGPSPVSSAPPCPHPPCRRPDRPILRNHSDLGPRFASGLKKKVTYHSSWSTAWEVSPPPTRPSTPPAEIASASSSSSSSEDAESPETSCCASIDGLDEPKGAAGLKGPLTERMRPSSQPFLMSSAVRKLKKSSC